MKFLKSLVFIIVLSFIVNLLFSESKVIATIDNVYLATKGGDLYTNGYIVITKVIREDKKCISLSFCCGKTIVFSTEFSKGPYFDDFMDVKYCILKFNHFKAITAKYYEDNKEFPEYMPRLMYNVYLNLIFLLVPNLDKESGKVVFYFGITPDPSLKIPVYFLLTDSDLAQVVNEFEKFQKENFK